MSRDQKEEGVWGTLTPREDSGKKKFKATRRDCETLRCDWSGYAGKVGGTRTDLGAPQEILEGLCFSSARDGSHGGIRSGGGMWSGLAFNRITQDHQGHWWQCLEQTVGGQQWKQVCQLRGYRDSPHKRLGWSGIRRQWRLWDMVTLEIYFDGPAISICPWTGWRVCWYNIQVSGRSDWKDGVTMSWDAEDLEGQVWKGRWGNQEFGFGQVSFEILDTQRDLK